MTKQEKMREGIAKLINDAPATLSNEDLAFRIMGYEDSEGVVIKVNKELPDISYYSAYPEIIEDTQKDMLKAGYVAVESLVIDNGKDKK